MAIWPARAGRSDCGAMTNGPEPMLKAMVQGSGVQTPPVASVMAGRSEPGPVSLVLVTVRVLPVTCTCGAVLLLAGTGSPSVAAAEPLTVCVPEVLVVRFT